MSIEVLRRQTQEKSPIESVKDNRNCLTEYLRPEETEKQLRTMYLINTRLWFNGLGIKSIDDVPDTEWEKLFEKYDNFWFMGIYRPSQKGQENAKKYWEQYQYYLPDIDKEKDVVSSPFAVPEYYPNPAIANSWQEWDKMVEKLHQKGKRVFIDFVPNHTALDHPWVESHPEYYIQGDKQQYQDNPSHFVEIIDNHGQIRYLAHGKDPYFDPWSDTLQLNYANLELQKRMEEELINLSKHADGFRCDMAVLITPDVFLKTWGSYLSNEEKQNLESSLQNRDEDKQNLEFSFWRRVVSRLKEATTREGENKFELIAEAYWEVDKIEKYFDFIYNHDLYKQIVETLGNGPNIDLKSHLDYLLRNPNNDKKHWVFYTENHDEKRAVDAMDEQFSKPAAVLSAMIKNSIFMVNQGQEVGCRYHPPMQVFRCRKEDINQSMAKFYDELILIRRSRLFQTGDIKIIEPKNYDQNSILFEVVNRKLGQKAIVVVNISREITTVEVDNKEDPVLVYSLTSGQESNDYQVGLDNLSIRLIPGEVKIIFLSDKSIQTRQNIDF